MTKDISYNVLPFELQCKNICFVVAITNIVDINNMDLVLKDIFKFANRFPYMNL